MNSGTACLLALASFIVPSAGLALEEEAWKQVRADRRGDHMQ